MSVVEKSTDLETKYHKLAAEYSKVRSHATVLKKAVLDEQTKNIEMKEILKEQEQKIRKHMHEMESLTFRNEQLAKRITVLQQELQGSINSKKGKNKGIENNIQPHFSVLDEELHKKILENAELVSTMADRELEVNNYISRVQNLEDEVVNLKKQIEDDAVRHKREMDKLLKETLKQSNNEQKIDTKSTSSEECESCLHWKREAERWQRDLEIIESRPESQKDVWEYYESKISDMLEAKSVAQSEAASLWDENKALNVRLEQLTIEKNKLEAGLEKCNEELVLTNENYKGQLDAMTEHFAAQNEKIAEYCDEIEMLKHKLSSQKK